MVRFKKILAVFLAVCILSLSVGSSYKVEAGTIVAGAGLTAATVFQICFFVGCTLVTCYAVGEIIDNRDEIARAGKNFIDSITSIPEGWILSMTDASGQEYVFGSEALELVQEMDWEVIQGGGGANNDNNDDDDDDNKNGWFDGLLNLSSSAKELVGSFTALGSVWFYDTASKLYQKWVNGEEMTEAEAAVIEPFVSGYCNQYDIAAQWSVESFDYYANINVMNSDFSNIYNLSASYEFPIVGYMRHVYANEYDLKFFKLNNQSIDTVGLKGTYKYINKSGTYIYDYNSVNVFASSPLSFSYSVNFPVFSNIEDAENYLKGFGDIENALNYKKIWREADWLADDWQGLLVDPFANVGLSLSQLEDLAKAIGLHAVGNDLTPSELADLIAESLPEVNPELLPDEVGVPVITPEPGLEPIYFPSPAAHPIPDNTNPSPNPNPTPNPDLGTITENVNIDDIVPDVISGFSDISDTLKTKFPFSLPWDIHYLLTGLASTPKTPVYYLPLVIERLGINETIVIDMSDFEELSKLSRAMLSFIWAYVLMNWTVKIVQVRKEE